VHSLTKLLGFVLHLNILIIVYNPYFVVGILLPHWCWCLQYVRSVARVTVCTVCLTWQMSGWRLFCRQSESALQQLSCQQRTAKITRIYQLSSATASIFTLHSTTPTSTRLHWLPTEMWNGFMTRFRDVLDCEIRPSMTTDSYVVINTMNNVRWHLVVKITLYFCSFFCMLAREQHL